MPTGNNELQGDLEKFLRQEHRTLLGYAKNHMGPALLATESPEDMLQTAFQHAFKDIQQLQSRGRTTSDIKPWFYGILNKVIALAARKHLGTARKTRKGLLRLESDLLNAQSADGPRPSRKAAASEALQLLKESIQRLPEDWQTVLNLHYSEEMSIAEVSAKIGRSTDATMALLQRARNRLRELMGCSSLYFLPSPKRKPKREVNE